MKKKPITTKYPAKKKAPQDTERGFGVILEDIDSKLDRILEGHSALEKQASDFQGETRENFKLVHLRIDGLTDTVEDFYDEFSGFEHGTESNFKTAFKYLSRIDDEIADIKTELADIKLRLTKKADLDRVEDLERRIKTIETILAKSK